MQFQAIAHVNNGLLQVGHGGDEVRSGVSQQGLEMLGQWTGKRVRLAQRDEAAAGESGGLEGIGEGGVVGET